MVSVELIVTVAVFLAGGAGAVIGAGWRLNRSWIRDNSQRIDVIEDQTGEIHQFLLGSDLVDGDGEIRSINEKLGDIERTAGEIDRRMIRLTGQLDDLDEIREFDASGLRDADSRFGGVDS